MSFAFPRRNAALIFSLIITTAAAGVCVHHTRLVQAQSNSAGTEALQNELAQLSADVNAFLDRGSNFTSSSEQGAHAEGARQQLLRRLSSFENELRTLTGSPDQSRNLLNAARDLEEKLFHAPAAPLKQPTLDRRSTMMSGVKAAGTDSNQIHPEATGTVTGKVVDSGAHPIANVFVLVTDNTGHGPNGLTDSAGNYSVSGISPGTYYVVTENDEGYLDQIYNGVPCLALRCFRPTVVANATTISVTSGNTTANINFTLQKGGAISAKITDAGTSAAVSGLPATIYDANGTEVVTNFSDASGNVMSPGLPPGTYYVVVLGFNGYIGQIYNNITCVGQPCNAAAGTPIVVNTVPVNINIALTKGGALSGVVTDAGNSAPLASMGINIVNSSGHVVDSEITDASGAYQSQTGLPTGTYFVKVFTNDTYLGQIYNGVSCPDPFNCPPTNGTPISLTNGLTTTGINFALQKGGQIAGKITDAANTPVANGEVDVYDANGTLISFAFPDASGNYTLFQSLSAGTYYARTFDSGLINQLYNGITCNGDCDVTTGTPIVVSLGATTGNINFTLHSGGGISGKVVDTANNSPLNFVTVQAYDSSGKLTGSAKPNNAGIYNISGLPAGTYYVRTLNKAQYVDQLFSGVQCAFQNCSPTSGTPITVADNVTTLNVNFALQLGGRIGGTVINAANSLGIAGASVNIYDANGIFVESEPTFNGGLYSSETGFPTGTYFARTSNTLGYLDQLYSGISCALGCNAKSGTPINLTAGATVSNINFVLQKGGTISGKVTDATSHNPVPNIFVDIYDPSGNLVTNGVSDGTGNYVTFDGLPSGKYFAQSSNSQNYIDALYNGIQCPLVCDPTSGTAIMVNAAANTANIDFALTKGGAITGKVTDAGTSTGISSVVVSIFDSTGTLITSASTNGAGAYTTAKGLPTGNYFAKSGNSQAYINQIYHGITCPLNSCVLTSGTPIAVSSGTTTSNINLALQKGGQITGKVIDAGNSQPLIGVTVRIFDSSGTFVTSGTTNGAGIYASTVGLPTGVYLAKTSNTLGYIEQLYQNIQCAGCSVTSGTSIPLVVGSQTNLVDFALSKGGTASGTVLDAVSRFPLESVSVTVYDGGGRAVSSGTTDASGKYVTGAGLPTGSYFVATSNELGYLDELYNAIPCPVGCAVTAGTPISITAGSNTPNIDFALPPAPTPTPTPTPSTLQFGQAFYSVFEDCTAVTITVAREGETASAASVDYATQAGTANERADYNTAIGTLNFAPGETAKSFDVLINEDAFVESTESFTVALSNPSGATLGSLPSATVQIFDHSPGSTGNPIDTADDFIGQHYHDFLNRQDDPSGLAFWINTITSCGNDAACVQSKLVNASGAFFLSIEFQETGGFAIRVQRGAFGKKSDDATSRITYTQFIHDARLIGDGVIVGQPGYDARLEANKQAYINQVVTSAAFTSLYASGLTADQFVDALFASAGVTPTDAERQAAINAFGGGDIAGRAAALRSVSDSNSVRAAEFSPSFVLMQYFGYLRRNPTAAPDNNDNGYQFWLAKLSSSNGDFNKAEMVKAFILSSEYRSRFGSP